MMRRVTVTALALVLAAAGAAEAGRHSTLKVNGVCDDGETQYTAALTFTPNADTTLDTLRVKLSGKGPRANVPLSCEYTCDFGGEEPLPCPIETDDKGKFKLDVTITNPPECSIVTPVIKIDGDGVICRFATQ